MTGVILARGSNRRYPILKGLIEFRGKRSIERVAESCTAAHLSTQLHDSKIFSE